MSTGVRIAGFIASLVVMAILVGAILTTSSLVVAVGLGVMATAKFADVCMRAAGYTVVSVGPNGRVRK